MDSPPRMCRKEDQMHIARITATYGRAVNSKIRIPPLLFAHPREVEISGDTVRRKLYAGGIVSAAVERLRAVEAACTEPVEKKLVEG